MCNQIIITTTELLKGFNRPGADIYLCNALNRILLKVDKDKNFLYLNIYLRTTSEEKTLVPLSTYHLKFSIHVCKTSDNGDLPTMRTKLGVPKCFSSLYIEKLQELTKAISDIIFMKFILKNHNNYHLTEREFHTEINYSI